MRNLMIGFALAAGVAMMAGCRNTAIVYDDAALAVNGARASGSYSLESVRVDTPYSLGANPSLFGALFSGNDDDDDVADKSDKPAKPRTANEKLSRWLVAKSPDSGVFVDKTAPDGKQRTPVKIVVQGKKEVNEGWGTCLNNFLSFCTIAIWPTYGSELCTYTVEAEVDGKKRTKTFSIEERRLTSWLPTGMIPVPAMADSRGSVRLIDKAEKGKVYEAVLSLFSAK